MNGPTPPRKRFPVLGKKGKPSRGDGGQSGSAREDERGPEASSSPAVGRGPDEVTGTDLVAGENTTVDTVPPAEGGRAGSVRGRVRRGRELARAGVGQIADRLIDVAPRIPVRDLDTLRRQFPGSGPEEIADKLVSGAANATSTVGAGVGAAAMMPVPPAMPAELAAEISGVALIELKLVAELHEVYGLRPPGTLRQRSVAYLNSWSEERGIDVTKPSTLNGALGGQMKRELRQQIMKRMVRNLPNLLPFMVGAAVGAVMNRRDTRKLAGHIRDDLRRRQVPWSALEALEPLEKPADALDPGSFPGGPTT